MAREGRQRRVARFDAVLEPNVTVNGLLVSLLMMTMLRMAMRLLGANGYVPVARRGAFFDAAITTRGFARRARRPLFKTFGTRTGRRDVAPLGLLA